MASKTAAAVTGQVLRSARSSTNRHCSGKYLDVYGTRTPVNIRDKFSRAHNYGLCFPFATFFLRKISVHLWMYIIRFLCDLLIRASI